jgi:uncharacterized protein YbjT (DUF2867 family)
MERTILVIGATGAMGRPVVQHLLAASAGSFRVRKQRSQRGGRV